MSDDANVVCSATLLVLGDDLDPRRVTELLGIEPTRSWRRGERKSFTRRDGEPHCFESLYEWGGWKCSLPDDVQNEALDQQLAWWCDLLEGREPAMRELEAEGYSLRMRCYVGAGESAVVEVSADLQTRLSNLRLGLTLSFHAHSSRLPDAAESE